MHPVLPGSPLEMAKLTAKLAVMVEAAKAEAVGETGPLTVALYS